MLETPPSASGVYRWYITLEGARALGIDLEGCTRSGGHYLVYVGLAKDLRQRLDWHWNDKHSPSSVKSGFVSTLRQSLSALLVGEMVTARERVDSFMRTQMRVEWETCENYQEREADLIREHSLPLNLRGNAHPFLATLKRKRKECKRKSLEMLS